MINVLWKRIMQPISSAISRIVVVLALIVGFMLQTSHVAEGAKAVKYKKQTVVDFEGALVEGKSRKPYSSYLTQQKDTAFSDLSSWTPDYEQLWQNTLQRADETL